MEKQSTRKFLKLIVALVALFLLGASALMLASCNKDEHQHSYTSSVTTPATCSNPGVETFTCSCGYAYTQIIPATGDHDWQVLQVYPNSCESDGYTVYECSVCHEQKQGDWTPKRDHKYEAVETVEATCTTDGYQIMQCSYCGDRYTDDQYSSEHKATGHKWIANTDAEDPASAEDKKLGFVTVKEADCLNAAQLERKCSVCGHSEPKEGAPALGHLVDNAVPTKNLCKIDESLVDAEGNAVYAFECERENCPVEVKIDKAGNTAHYVKAAEHKMKVVKEVTYCVDEDSEELLPSSTDAKGEGVRYEICENCDTYGTELNTTEDTLNKKTEIAATGHKWNTIQLDDESPVVVCEADAELNTPANYYKVMEAAWGVQKYSQKRAALIQYYTDMTTAVKNANAQGFSRYCSDCGALQIAGGHDYVIAALEEGKYDLDDYEKDENGLPVEAEGVTVATMDCRYVQVCKNPGCGDVLERGKHGETTAATCRDCGKCETCGEDITDQLTHTWIKISELVDKDGKFIKNDATQDTGNADANGCFKGTNIKREDAFKAYEKLVADNAWMKPVVGNCEDETTEVYVCAQCLVDAVKEDVEVTWNTATEFPVGTTKPAETATSTNAYVISTGFGHDYQPTYFRLNGEEIVYEQTNCELGFMVKYVCTRCEEVFTNVPVANDPDTKPEKGDEVYNSKTNEAAVNEPKAPANLDVAKFFTDADGFVINMPVANGNYEGQENLAPYYKSTDFQADELAAALAAKNNHKGDHLVTVVAGYQGLSSYDAPTCIATADLPVVCAKCGATLDYNYSTLADAAAEENKTNAALHFTVDTDWDDAVQEADKKYSATNHAGDPFDCGATCNVKSADGTTYICSGYVKDNATQWNQKVSEVGNEMKEAAHTTIIIDYKLTVASNYYSDYTIRVATVGANAIDGNEVDWTKVSFSTVSQFSVCANNTFTDVSGNMTADYKAPMAYSEGSVAADDTYFVLTDAKGNNYPVTSFTLYTEDKGNTTGTAIEAGGTTTVSQKDTFFLNIGDSGCKAPIHATTSASLEKAFVNAQPENGVLTVQLAATADFSVDGKIWGTVANNAKDATSLVIDLNGAKLTSTVGIPFDAFETIGTITIKNGTFTFTNEDTSSVKYAIQVGNGASGVDLVFDDVDLVVTKASTAVSVVYSDTQADQSTVTFKNGSTITSYGKIGIAVDAPKVDTVSATLATVVTLNDTDVVMANATPTSNTFSTALLVGAPVIVKVDDSTLSAAGQALVVRGGEVNVADSDLVLTKYTAPKDEVSEDTFKTGGILANDVVDYSAVAPNWAEFNDGITDLQTYRIAGLWGNGNAVPRAAVVIGNSDKTDYQFVADVELKRVDFTVESGDETIVLGTVYDEDIYTTEDTSEGAEKGDTVPVDVITLNVTGSALTAASVLYTFNSYDENFENLVYEDNINLIGFVK